jgi:hypothetical protein
LHGLSGLSGEVRRRGFLHDFLVSALHGALSLGEGHDISVGVGQDLDFDVVRVLDESLNQHSVIAKGAKSLGFAQTKSVADFGIVVGDSHPFSSSSSRRFDHHWISNFVGKLNSNIFIFHFALETRNDKASSVLHDLLRVDLVTHGVHWTTWWANENDSCRFHHIDEFRILREETITRVNSLKKNKR